MVVESFGCFQIVLGRFRWFLEMSSFSSYGEIPCFKFKRSSQHWEDFAVSRKNDVKVPLKQIPRFPVTQNINFHLKTPCLGRRRFFLY